MTPPPLNLPWNNTLGGAIYIQLYPPCPWGWSLDRSGFQQTSSLCVIPFRFIYIYIYIYIYFKSHYSAKRKGRLCVSLNSGKSSVLRVYVFLVEFCVKKCNSNFKIGSHDTIHTFKNYFTTVFSVFSNKQYPNRLYMLCTWGFFGLFVLTSLVSINVNLRLKLKNTLF